MTKIRMTRNKRQMLQALRPDNESRCPPYTAQELSDFMGKPVSNVYRTLKQLKASGVVWAEQARREVGAEIPRRGFVYCLKPVTVYWCAQHIERDKVFRWAVDVWADAKLDILVKRMMPLPGEVVPDIPPRPLFKL